MKRPEKTTSLNNGESKTIAACLVHLPLLYQDQYTTCLSAIVLQETTESITGPQDAVHRHLIQDICDDKVLLEYQVLSPQEIYLIWLVLPVLVPVEPPLVKIQVIPWEGRDQREGVEREHCQWLPLHRHSLGM